MPTRRPDGVSGGTAAVAVFVSLSDTAQRRDTAAGSSDGRRTGGRKGGVVMRKANARTVGTANARARSRDQRKRKET